MAGWAVHRSVAPATRSPQTGLERYAEYFDAVEINSTFYRLPRAATLERWRESTPSEFRFSVKLPRTITHEARLFGVESEVRAFCRLAAHLGSKLGPLLVQLPPSLAFDARSVGRFLPNVVRAYPGAVVLEARHISWLSDRVEALLTEHGVARVAADPALCPPAAEPAGAARIAYFRWHGTPRMYFSAYDSERLASFAHSVRKAALERGASEIYCIFDNTGLGAAPVNALELKSLLGFRARPA
jgi:uncharacterized protein YecE (DUF72 family)